MIIKCIDIENECRIVTRSESNSYVSFYSSDRQFRLYGYNGKYTWVIGCEVTI